MSTPKSLVLVLGATGLTGSTIVDALLKSDSFRVAALIRPASAAKPSTEELKSSGVEVRVGQMTDDFEKLKEYLQGVDILISSVDARVIAEQREIFRAAKEVGVKRVVPGNWATPGAKGVRLLTDVKYEINEYIKELGLNYTIIDVGAWMQVSLPLPERSAAPLPAKQGSWSIYGTGEAKNLYINLEHIGAWVVRIIADPRTLNKQVIVWEAEATQKDLFELGVRFSGDGEALRAKRINVSEEEIERQIVKGGAEFAKDPNDFAAVMKFVVAQYMKSMHFLEENSLENAKRLGYIDARELYPDIPVQSLEEYAKEFYSLPEPAKTLLRL